MSHFPLKPIPTMKPFLFSAALILVASSNVHATEALIFDAGRYNIQILIGMMDEPGVAQVHFTPPGAKDWVSIPRELLHIKKFDMKKHILTMHFSNKNNLDLPGSFPFLSSRPGLSSLLAAKKLRVNSIGPYDVTAKFAPSSLFNSDRTGERYV